MTEKEKAELLRQHLVTIQRIRECWLRMPAYFSDELHYKRQFIKDALNELGIDIDSPEFLINKRIE